MQKNVLLYLLVVCIVVILVAGCTSTSNTATTATHVPITTTEIIPIVTTQAPMTTTPSITTSQTPAIETTLSSFDPILHRWVRQYPTFTSSMPWAAYQYKFYPDGSVVYNFGTPAEVSSNIKVVSQYEASGTWVKTGNNTYLVKVLPIGTASGAPLIREYTWVPTYIDKQYGKTIPEHLVSQDEIDALPKAREQLQNEMFYPERAKID